jgi:hypothetical protein
MRFIRDLIERGYVDAWWVWWLWDWLDEEVLRDADRTAVAGL